MSQAACRRRAARPHGGWKPSVRQCGFSLLEVIIATAILAGSSVVLMSMFSTGDRHALRANKRMIAQMLCQTKLEELLANPALLMPIEAEVFPQYPGWVYSTALEATTLEGFVQLTVSVTHIPGEDVGANLEIAATAAETEFAAQPMVQNVPEQPTFQLVRWLEFHGDVTGFSTASEASFLGQSEL